MSLATLLLIACLIVTAVDLTMRDRPFLEQTHAEIKSYASESLNSRLPDVVGATQRLLDYMRGDVNDIYYEGYKGMLKTEMFPSTIEKVHMREVRNLWQRIAALRNFAAIGAIFLFLLGIVLQRRQLIPTCGAAICYAYMLFGVIAAFVGIWAVADFDGFWTFFHQVAFPNSTNWLLPAGTNMIEMLPQEFFSAYVTRIGIYGAALLAPLPLLSLTGIIALRVIERRTEKRAIAARANRDPLAAITVEDAPDLLSLHRKMNTPLSKRNELAETAQWEAEIRGDVEEFGREDRE